MNKIANVVFAYSPTNDDELELTVGDKIEVIGFEEEGWWKGRLKGRVGVFPSNFVQVVETTTGPTQQQQQQQATPNSNNNKLNSLFGSLVNAKNNISSNSLNNITSHSNNNLNISNNNKNSNNNNNNNNSTGSNNLIMNNTHQQQQPHESQPSGELSLQSGADESLNSSSSMSERRPKPLRGMGYGDIFVAGAKTKPLPADPLANSKITTAMASERPSTISMSSTLQRPIPKKPPPPAPADISAGTNGSPATSDQAPALPPKPGNTGYSPFLQQRPLPQPQTAQQRANREQVRVIYAYTPTNSDELVMRVGDIIDVIDKNIEDAGWWRGELNGKIGVFPDNFVEVITPQETSTAQDWQNSSRLSASAASNLSNNTSNSGGGNFAQQPVSSTEGRIKSVFAGTPKGFSKELESNLEKHNSPASFLSLKRNKLQQQVSSSGLPIENVQSSASLTACLDNATSTTASNSITASLRSDFSETQNGHTTTTTTSSSPLETSPGKLNHITANRAKGPSRRPPTNILNKRNQLYESSSSSSSSAAAAAATASNNHKRKSIDLKDDQPLASLPSINQALASSTAVTATATSIPTPAVNQSLTRPETSASSPAEQKQQTAVAAAPPSQIVSSHVSSLGSSPFTTPTASEQVSPSNSKTAQSSLNNSSNSNNVSDGNQVPSVPKTNQRAINQSPVIGQQQDSTARSKLTASMSTTSTPPWMVELRKTNAEKKRDPPTSTASVGTLEDVIGSLAPINSTPPVVTPPTVIAPPSMTSTPTAAAAAAMPAVTTPKTPPTIAPATSVAQHPPLAPPAAQANGEDAMTAKFDSILKQISNDMHNEISELKSEVKKLRENFKCVDELKVALDAMKVELRTCQSATESQRRYIKDLVNNLADERKRIAAMQVEIDRNLK